MDKQENHLSQSQVALFLHELWAHPLSKGGKELPFVRLDVHGLRRRHLAGGSNGSHPKEQGGLPLKARSVTVCHLELNPSEERVFF